MGKIPVPLFYYKGDIKMPLNETFTGIIEKLTQRIDELKSQMGELRTQVGEVDTRSTMAYNQSVSLADAIAQQAEKLKAMTEQVNELETQMATRSVTTTTPPTADGTGLPGFVVLDTKPATEYQNYVYIYPRDQK